MIRVLLADDHHLVRAGLRTLLASASDIDVVGEASDGEQALAAARDKDPDVILMDLSMPGVDGITATRRLASERPQTRVVALTTYADSAHVKDALSAGAVGYLLKDCTPDELLSGIRAAAAGHAPLDPRAATAVLPNRTQSAQEQLSAREIEVLRMAGRGLANKQIARALGISEGTVKAHLGSVFRTIGVTDRTSAALWAREHLPGDLDQRSGR